MEFKSKAVISNLQYCTLSIYRFGTHFLLELRVTLEVWETLLDGLDVEGFPTFDRGGLVTALGDTSSSTGGFL